MEKILKRISVLAVIAAMILGVTGISYADDNTSALEDGLYKVDCPDPSSMFRIYEPDANTCMLKVKDGQMTAIFRLNGPSYDLLFMGSKEDAAAADSSQYIGRTGETVVTEEEGVPLEETIYTYQIPVSALGENISVAAHSIQSGKWFDRTMNFSNPRTLTAAESLELYEGSKSADSAKAEYESQIAEKDASITSLTAQISALTAKVQVLSTSVSGVKASALSSKHKIKVRWTSNAKVDYYKVYRATSPTGTYKVTNTTKSAYATVSGQKKGKTYYYKVKGYKTINGSAVSCQYSKLVKATAK